MQNYDPSFFFYVLAKEFGWTEHEIAEMHVPFIMKMIDNLREEYEMQERELKRYGVQ